MAFKDDVSVFTAAQIIHILGCPRGTAYDWLDGRREPPDWQQPHWLAILRRHPLNRASQETSRKGKAK